MAREKRELDAEEVGYAFRMKSSYGSCRLTILNFSLIMWMKTRMVILHLMS